MNSSQQESGLTPLQVLLLAPFSGSLVTLSLAPFDLWPLGILSCALLAWLLSTCQARAAFWRGWLYGLGMFGSGVSWVYVSIHVHGYAPVPLAALLTLLFCAGLALFPALFAWCYVRLVRALPGGMLAGFPVLWVLAEWLRSWVLTGFPWLLLGYAHIDTWIAGWAPVVGVFGLSFICALSGSCLFLAWRSRRAVAIATYAVIAGLLWAGGGILKPIQWVAPASETPLSVAIYQPNIPQVNKWDRRYYHPILQQMERASEPLMGADILLWPEAAIPNYYQNARDFIDPIAERARLLETTLITGIPFRPEGEQHYHNSIIALGQGEGVYHKQRLVPFGEYVPLEQFLRGLIAFFDLPMSAFTPGPGEQPPLRAGAFRIAPFICYEIVYPDLVARGARDADLLVTISNDSWFGDSIGPLQHLQMAQMRALENGRYLIRGTNNGVSAIINYRGEIVADSERFVETSLRGDAETMLGNTPFTSFGSLPVISGSVLGLVLMYLLYLGFWRDND
ncbi:apolipoprotein N-acyltransferase [Pseudohalioglobus sediminis]|uniref:Apolipoprotein N-acyltransferase n=1 Tax=Pseudohalioglobus sediminis TaxID=2606449 RepID=A0A5B0WUJ9_9GAMM|nr:apolipoprotein N-acyltransferase [Pseudohalioglobus sediminis]KAA1189975.1 apolipoprotein N-acyltransferase [Pseudohalioglobus sediminis]